VEEQNKMKMTKKKLLGHLKELDLDAEQRAAVVCAIVGHSRIINICLGQVTCSRCDEILGDTLAGVYDIKDKVIVGHNCNDCKMNYAQLTWRDKLYTPDPFAEEKNENQENSKSA